MKCDICNRILNKREAEIYDDLSYDDERLCYCTIVKKMYKLENKIKQLKKRNKVV